jgi:hypothetical protein
MRTQELGNEFNYYHVLGLIFNVLSGNLFRNVGDSDLKKLF